MIYVYEYSECDGVKANITLIKNANTIAKAIEIFKKQFITEMEEYCGEDDFERQLKYHKFRRNKVCEVMFLEVAETCHFDMEAFTDDLIYKIKSESDKQKKEERRKQYEALKKEFE